MKILVLAGGYDHIALIKKLQNRGHEVLLADYFSNPPAKQYADKHFQISTLDERAIYSLAVLQKVDFIVSACTDQALMTVARISEKLGLPCYINAETAQMVTNKAYMKKKLTELNIPTAQSILLEDENNYMKQLPDKLEFPLVVKPCDCNSSKGVVKVSNQEELNIAIKNGFLYSRSKKVVVEDFMEGKEVSIDVWKDKEGVKILSISETSKIKTNKNSFTIFQSKYPVDISNNVQNEIQVIAENITKGFSLENCPILIQAIINNDEVKVIEFSTRIGGGSKYKFIEYMTGIDILDVFVNRILGDTNQIVIPHYSEKLMELDYVYTEKGTFGCLYGFDEAKKKGDICEIFQYKPEGSFIEKRTTSSDRVAGFLIQADDFESLKERRCRVLDQVDVLDINGKSIMYKDCFYQN